MLQVVVAAETQRAPILQTEGANVQPGIYRKTYAQKLRAVLPLASWQRL